MQNWMFIVLIVPSLSSEVGVLSNGDFSEYCHLCNTFFSDVKCWCFNRTDCLNNTVGCQHQHAECYTVTSEL